MPHPTDPVSSRSAPREAWPLVRGALAEVGALAFPVPCVGCGVPPNMLCATCRHELRPDLRSRELALGAEPGMLGERALGAHGAALWVWSGLPFDGVPARAIRALKAELRTPLARALAPALGCALDAAWAATAASGPLATGPPLLVPVPTSRASWRHRGVRIVELLMHRAGARPCRALRPARRVADQRGLDRAGRADNVAHSMRGVGLRGAGVVLIDDVVTTGATLVEASRAVTAAGGAVFGAVTLASTPRVFGGSELDA